MLKKIPLFIICRDRTSCLLSLINYLEKTGFENIILVDNNSTYEPLLAYYKSTPHKVECLGTNLGHLCVWESELYKKYQLSKTKYIVTDPDILPVEDCPNDFAEYFEEVLYNYPQAMNCGFGLKIDDIPKTNPFRNNIIECEGKMWNLELAAGLYNAPIDTTFALYKPLMFYGKTNNFRSQWAKDISDSIRMSTLRSIRTGYPYIARHTTWYISKPNEEELYYIARCQTSNCWSSKYIKRN